MPFTSSLHDFGGEGLLRNPTGINPLATKTMPSMSRFRQA